MKWKFGHWKALVQHYTLRELLTIKSDDMQGRNDTLNAIVKGQPIPTYGRS